MLSVAALLLLSLSGGASEELRQGSLALADARWPDAIRHLEAARRLRPAHAETLYYLGQAYHLDGQRARALETVRQAARLDPASPEMAQKLGEYLCEANLCKEGLAQLRKARGLDPDLDQIDFDLGMAYHRQTELPEARRHLEKALALEPANLVAARFLADVLGRDGEWEKARPLYEVVAAREPGNAWALYGLGRSLLALGQAEAALAPLGAALRADPTLAEAHFQLGQALRELGRRDESQEELRLFRILRDRARSGGPALKSERTPFEARVWDTCAAFLREGKEAEAFASLRRLSAADARRADYLLGVLYLSLGRSKDAVRLLSRAAAAAPGDADVIASLGRAYVAEGDYQLGSRVIGRAQALAPDGELPLVAAGELEYAQGRLEQASALFEASKTAQVPVLLKLCRSYARTGNAGKAAEAAIVIRAFARDDQAALRELDSILAAAPGAP